MDIDTANFISLKMDGIRSRAFKPMSRQEEKALRVLIQTGDRKAAREAAGFARTHPLPDNILQAYEYFSSTEICVAAATREEVTGMLRESHAKASEVRDEISAARELGKLWGLYESDRIKREVVSETNITNNNHLEILTDAQLLEKAGLNIIDLAPEAVKMDDEVVLVPPEAVKVNE